MCPNIFLITCLLLIFIGSAASSNVFPFSPGFDIKAVLSLAISLPSHSWEFGTASEALLELYEPQYAVFGADPFPVPTISPSQSVSLGYAQEKIVIGSGANGLSDGDGAVGDPASLGVSAILLGMTEKKYFSAAKKEVEFILGEAPRWWNGAISQRVQYAELWLASFAVYPHTKIDNLINHLLGRISSIWHPLSLPIMGLQQTMRPS